MARVLLAKARRLGYGEEEIVLPLGIMYLASVLREAGHEVRIYDCGRDWDDPERFRRALLDAAPDVVGLSSITYEAPVMEGMAHLCKATLPDVPVIAGGPHPSAYPERCCRLGPIDYVAIGEAERTAVELVDALTRGGRDPRSIRGLAYWDERTGEVVRTPPREFIEDLDSLPFPAWDLVDNELYWQAEPCSGMGRRRYMALMTSRGCPFRCIYCHQVHGKRFRARSPENVLRELHVIDERYGIRDFEVMDDIVNADRARTLELCDRIVAANLRPALHFPNGVRTDLLDAEQIDGLRRAGTVSMCAPVETTSPRLQKLIKKNLDVEKVRDRIAIAVDRGIYVVGCFMLGFPTETYEEARGTLEWALRTDLHHSHFSLLTPYPGTAIHDLAGDVLRARGITDADIFAQHYQKGCCNVSAMSDEQLFGLQEEAYRRFNLDPRRAVRILLRHPDRKRLVYHGLLALYYSLPLGRTRRAAPTPLAWANPGPDPARATGAIGS